MNKTEALKILWSHRKCEHPTVMRSDRGGMFKLCVFCSEEFEAIDLEGERRKSKLFNKALTVVMAAHTEK